jgi:hypothetical protein
VLVKNVLVFDTYESPEGSFEIRNSKPDFENQNSTSKFKTRLRNSKLDFEIQNSTSKFKTPLRNSKFDFEIQNSTSKFKTRLTNENCTSKFKTRFRNSKLDFEIQNSISKFKTQLRNSKLGFLWNENTVLANQSDFHIQGRYISGRLRRSRKVPIISDQSEVFKPIFICKHVLSVVRVFIPQQYVSQSQHAITVTCHAIILTILWYYYMAWGWRHRWPGNGRGFESWPPLTPNKSMIRTQDHCGVTHRCNLQQSPQMTSRIWFSRDLSACHRWRHP